MTKNSFHGLISKQGETNLEIFRVAKLIVYLEKHFFLYIYCDVCTAKPDTVCRELHLIVLLIKYHEQLQSRVHIRIN